jgi:hypothetical protein
MRKNLCGFSLLMIAMLTAGVAYFAPGSLAQARPLASTTPEASLKRFLRKYVGVPVSADDKTTRYFAAFADLRDDGTHEVIVYLSNGGWCGSGGCTTLILAPKDSCYKVVSKILVTRPPISVLATKSHGWHDLAVRVQGGGDVRAYEAKLSFDGKSYPISPANGRGQRLTGNAAGKVAVPVDAKGELLY